LNTIFQEAGIFTEEEIVKKTKAAFLIAKFSSLKYIFAEITVMVLFFLRKRYGNLLYPVTKTPICKELFAIAAEVAVMAEIQQILSSLNESVSTVNRDEATYDLKLVDCILSSQQPQGVLISPTDSLPPSPSNQKRSTSVPSSTKAPVIHSGPQHSERNSVDTPHFGAAHYKEFFKLLQAISTREGVSAEIKIYTLNILLTQLNADSEQQSGATPDPHAIPFHPKQTPGAERAKRFGGK